MDLAKDSFAALENSSKLSSLDQQRIRDYKDLLNDAIEAGYQALNTAYQAAIDKYTPVADAAGMEKITYTDEELAAFREKAAKPVWDAWVEKQSAAGVPAQELLDLVLKTAAEAAAQ